MPGLAWSSDSRKVGSIAQPQQSAEQEEQDVMCMVEITNDIKQYNGKQQQSGPAIPLQTSSGSALLQLPAPALAAIAEQLSTAEKLQLGRLVFGREQPDAAAAVLGTVRSCSFKEPAASQQCCGVAAASGVGDRDDGASNISSSMCNMAALSSMHLLQQLSLQLQLPEQHQYCPAVTHCLSGLVHLTALEVKFAGATQPVLGMQQQGSIPHHVAALLQAVGQLQNCQHLALQLDVGPAAMAAMLGPDSLQPLLLLPCLQSLSILTAGRLPTTALQQIGKMARLTRLCLTCDNTTHDCITAHAAAAGDAGEAAIIDSLRPLCRQLKQLTLVRYFHKQQHSDGGSCLSQMLHSLHPNVLQMLDLSHNMSSPFPGATAAVAALTNLQSLCIAGIAVTADVMAVLGQELCQLTQLDISHTSAAALHQQDQYGEAVLPLQRWLPHCAALKELRLQGRALAFQDMLLIFEVPQLQYLDIAGAHIDPNALATAVVSSSCRRHNGSNTAELVSLSLRGIRIGPDKFASLHLEQLSSLEVLDLRACRPGGTAAAALRRAVPSLRVMHMEDLDWADEGLEWLIGDYY